MQKVAHSAAQVRPGAIESDEAFMRRFALVVRVLGGKRASARIIGMTDEQVRRWVSGQSRIPLTATVTLCRAAGVTIGWLVDGKGEVDLDRVVARVTEPRRRAARKVAA